jgi:large conductance mechanosensitive channel
MLKDFKEFAMRGNVVDMAVGIILGASFGAIVKSIVDDIIMPPIGFLLGNVDFSNLYLVVKEGVANTPYSSLVEAKKSGAITINYGLFINSVISFLIISFAVFLLIRTLNKLKRQEPISVEPSLKDCPYCASAINIKAKRCPQCTSELVSNNTSPT